MKLQTFREKIAARIAEVNSCVCVGLDSDPERIPECVREKDDSLADVMSRFNRAIIDATHDIVLAYKPNWAFYAAHGPEGMSALSRTIEYCHARVPRAVVIMDYKAGDIGSTNVGYVRQAFEYFGADAVTVNPYFGREAMQPFLDRRDKCIIVLCKTSNPGGGEFQDFVGRPPNGLPEELEEMFISEGAVRLYQYVAYQVSRHWNQHDNCALVVGATYPEQIADVRKIVRDMPLLLPGFGKQGATVADVVPVARDSQGGGFFANSSRGIIFASGGEDFAEVGRQNVIELRDESNRYRKIA